MSELLALAKATLCPRIKDYAPYLREQDDVYDAIENNLKKLIIADLRKQMKNTEPLKMVLNRLSLFNLFTKVVSKQAKVYTKTPPNRFDINSVDDDNISVISKLVNVDSLLTEVDYNGRAFNCCALEIVVHEGNLIGRALPANSFLPYSNDLVNPMKMTHISVYKGKYDGKDVWFHYSKDEICATDSEGNDLTAKLMDGIVNYVNPLKRLPFVYFNMSKNQLVPNPRHDLLHLAKLIPIMFSDINVGLMMQCFSIFVGINISPEDAAKFNVSPAAFWAIGSEEDSEGNSIQSDVKTVSPSMNVTQALEAILAQITLFLETNNLESKTVGNVNGNNASASGIAEIVKNIDTIEDLQVQQKRFIPFEKDLWNLINAMVDYGSKLGELDPEYKAFSATFKLGIDFPKAEVLKSSMEELQEVVLKMQNGLISKIDAVKAINPGKTDKQINKMVKDLAKESEENRKKAMEDAQALSKTKQPEKEEEKV